MQDSIPSARMSTLRIFSVSMSSLSQGMTVRSSIVAFSIGHKLIQPAFGDDEAADVLGQVAGKALDLVDQLHASGRRRRSVGSSPISRSRWCPSPPPAPPQPQIWLDMAASVSSDRPIARPTSRTARLPR